MFYGLSSGRVKIDGVTIRHILEDIQSLNYRALKGELEVTAVSAHAFAFVSDKYWLMSTGASMGEGYGPVLISKNYHTLAELKNKTVATPGKMTTATLLLKTFLPDLHTIDISFDQIMEGVRSGKYDAGLVIHEGQITYSSQGFKKILDFGEFWNSQFPGLPLPLGLDIVRKDLGEQMAHKLSHALKQSIHYGYTHQNESIAYALQYGRGIDTNLGEQFVKMYVNELTIDMGERGKQALERLYNLAFERNLIPQKPEIVLY
jgi:1,4-dihydroxy-6-naphthoate synthase